MAEERIPAIKLLLLPKDTNALGTIFGGVLGADSLSDMEISPPARARSSTA
jgi:hypothetical protein